MRTDPFQLTTISGRRTIAGSRQFTTRTEAMQQRKKILVIDDEEVISFGFSMVLKEPNVEIDCAHTLEEARNLIAANRYDAAVVDLRLSDSIELEGFECIRLVRARQNTCRIIVLTAYGDHEMRERAASLGVDHFYEKPLEPETLRKTLALLNVYEH